MDDKREGRLDIILAICSVHDQQEENRDKKREQGNRFGNHSTTGPSGLSKQDQHVSNLLTSVRRDQKG